MQRVVALLAGLAVAYYAASSLAAGGRGWAALAVIPLLLLFLGRPLIGIVAVIVLYPFLPESEGISAAEMLSSAVIGLLGFAWFFDTQVRGRRSYSPHGVVGLFFAWFGWLVVSLFVFLSHGGRGMDWLRDMVPFANLLLFLPFKDYVRSARQQSGMVYLVMVVLALTCLRPALSIVGAPIPSLSMNITTFHPTVLLLLGLALVSGGRRFNPAGIAAIAVAGGVALAVDNRTTVIGVLAAVILFFVAMSSSGKALAIGFALLVLGYFSVMWYADARPTAMEYKRARFESVLATDQDSSIQNRMDEARECWRVFQENPLFGAGIGYQYRFWRHFILFLGPGYMNTNFTHNDYLNLLAKTGLVGTLLWLVFLVAVLRVGWDVVSRSKDEGRRALAAALMVAVAIAQIIGQTTPVLQTREATYLLALVIGLLICLHRQEMEERAAEDKEAAAENAD